jgi:hypothetical protein
MNLFKSIFRDNLADFKKTYPELDTPYYDEVINKMLNCGTTAGGYAEYDCMHCGGDHHIVYFSCKSRLCLKCAKRRSAEIAENIAKQLIQGVTYRQVVLTMPCQLRDPFYEHPNQRKLYSAYMRASYDCLVEVFQIMFKKKNIKIAVIPVIHTHSRNGDYNPHNHVILGEGALDIDNEQWIKLKRMDLSVLRKVWQKHLLALVEIFFPDKLRLVAYLKEEHPDGFYTHPGENKGDKVPEKSNQLLKYLSAYLASPPIGLSRLDGYANNRVYYFYNSHQTGNRDLEVIKPVLFMKRMLQHLMPKGFQKMRYLGLQATSTFKKYLPMITKLLGDLIDKVINATRKLFYAEMFQKTVNRNPFVCRKCGKGMELSHLSHPDRGGTFFDAFAVNQ